MQKHVDTRKDGLALMLKGDAVKHVQETESGNSRCIFCRMFMFHVKSVAESVRFVRLWKYAIKGYIFMMY